MRRLFFILMLVAMLPACATRQETEPPATMDDAALVDALAGRVWVAETIAGRPAADMSHVSMVFTTDHQVSGSGGCNNYRGAYTVEDGEIVFGHVAATRRLCSRVLDKQEQRFFEVLEQIMAVSIDNGLLRFTPADGEPSVFSVHQ